MSSTPASKQLPKDALVMVALLKEMGVTSHEPRIINQMLDYVYRHITSVVEEAKVYSQYAKKKAVDLDDVKLAIKVISDKNYTSPPPREMLMELAKTKNTTPLPLIKSTSGLRLPPDRFCLTQPNYRLAFQKKASASTPVTAVRSTPVFKTPNPYPSSKSAGEPDPKKAKRDS